MPVPTSYTEATLAAYLLAEVGLVGTLLGWDSTAHSARLYQAVQDTERALGVSNVADATDAEAIERLGAVAVWRRALQDAAAFYTFALENGRQYKRSDVQAMIREGLAVALDLAADFLSEATGPGVQVASVRYADDPYAYIPCNLRALP